MGRRPCCEKVGLKRGPWTIEEDNKLVDFILNNGIVCWRLVPKLAGLLRCGKSCRLRWVNYLRPDLKRGDFTEEEEDQIIQLHSQYGNKWSKIASHFPGRTDNEIKNHWNTKIKKKLKRLGQNPQTQKPNEEIFQKDEINAEDRENEDDEIQDELQADENVNPPTEENEQEKSEANSNESTPEGREEVISIDDYEMLWQSLEEEPTMVSPTEAISQQSDNGATILDDDFHQWLNQVESMLFSDNNAPNSSFNEMSLHEHEHQIFSYEANYQYC